MLTDLLQPVLQRQKGFALGAVVDAEHAKGPLVVGGSDSLESFLASRVPQLQFDSLLVYVDHLHLEVNPDRGHVVLGEPVV